MHLAVSRCRNGARLALWARLRYGPRAGRTIPRNGGKKGRQSAAVLLFSRADSIRGRPLLTNRGDLTRSAAGPVRRVCSALEARVTHAQTFPAALCPPCNCSNSPGGRANSPAPRGIAPILRARFSAALRGFGCTMGEVRFERQCNSGYFFHNCVNGSCFETFLLINIDCWKIFNSVK